MLIEEKSKNMPPGTTCFINSQLWDVFGGTESHAEKGSPNNSRPLLVLKGYTE